MTKNNGSRVLRGIRSTSVITLMLIIAGCAGSTATVDTGAGAGSTGDAAAFAGTWEGTFDASEFSGEMMLALMYENGTCTGSLTASAMGESLTADIENFKGEGIECSFQTYMQGADLYFTGKIEDDKMIGTFVVYVEGDQADEGAFQFTKK